MQVSLVTKCPSGNTTIVERTSIASVLGSELDSWVNIEKAEYFEVFSIQNSFEGSLSCISTISAKVDFSQVIIVSSGHIETKWRKGDWTHKDNGEICIENLTLHANPLPYILHITFHCPKLTLEIFRANPADGEAEQVTAIVPLLWSDYLHDHWMFQGHSYRAYLVALQRDLRNNLNSGNISIDIRCFYTQEILDWSSKEISGTIPEDFGGFSSLQYLKLHKNNFSGDIPCALGQLSCLKELMLSENQLVGDIPCELGQLSSLQWLDLSNNQLSGNIPREISQLSSLQCLRLFNNELSGNIPCELNQLSGLKELDLHNNQLSEAIPIELGQLSSLRYLDLSNNQLFDSIPSEFGQLTAVQHMDLSSNDLCENIPVEICQLPSLERLCLDNNQLSGNIPDELFSKNFLWCNLSENYFLVHDQIHLKLWKMENYNKQFKFHNMKSARS